MKITLKINLDKEDNEKEAWTIAEFEVSSDILELEPETRQMMLSATTTNLLLKIAQDTQREFLTITEDTQREFLTIAEDTQIGLMGVLQEAQSELIEMSKEAQSELLTTTKEIQSELLTITKEIQSELLTSVKELTHAINMGIGIKNEGSQPQSETDDKEQGKFFVVTDDSKAKQ